MVNVADAHAVTKSAETSARRRHAPLTVREMVLDGSDHYADYAVFVPILTELVARYERHTDPDALEAQVEYLLSVAQEPYARAWVFFSEETPVGVLFVQAQSVYGTRRVFVFGYYLKPGYVVGPTGKALEAEVETWGRQCGATYMEHETTRSPSAWSRSRGYRLKGYVMVKPLAERSV